MFLSQLKAGGVICRENDIAQRIHGVGSLYELAQQAIRGGMSLIEQVRLLGLGETVDLPQLAADGLLDCPVRHPDPAHMFLTGTGLTHLGSASARDAMHATEDATKAGATDSMKMFRMGLEGGKPAAGDIGVQPEWFYKGTGVGAIAPRDALPSPDFALDGSEEPEIAAYYLIGEDGTPYRIGYSLANEFSDHVTERINYLYLAHSKLRPASLGPELLVGDLPSDIRGTSRIIRNGETVWQKSFLSGEDNMSHTLANLEYHHFKYAIFAQPGDLHVHMFGTATLSFADGVVVEAGDEIEIESPQLGLPLRNKVVKATTPAGKVKAL